MREIEPSALDKNVFKLVGEDWMLVTAGGPDKLNTIDVYKRQGPDDRKQRDARTRQARTRQAPPLSRPITARRSRDTDTTAPRSVGCPKGEAGA